VQEDAWTTLSISITWGVLAISMASSLRGLDDQVLSLGDLVAAALVLGVDRLAGLLIDELPTQPIAGDLVDLPEGAGGMRRWLDRVESMSGDGKRSVAAWPKLPRPSSTLPIHWTDPPTGIAACRG
jgi:hypothetical protein